MKSISLAKAAAVAAVSLFVSAGPASALEMPCTTAKLIVPWAAGGATGVIFGLFEKAINESDAPVKIKVITMPGQGGALGAKEAVKAKPDGCTLFAIHQHLIANYINGVTDFDWDGFEPVARLTDTPEIIGASGDVSFDDIPGMLAAAKARPNKIPTGVTLGATTHFLWIILGAKTDTSYAYVPFQGGDAARITGLMNGTIELGSINMAAARTQRGDGKLKALAIAADKRSPLIPDVPTLKEEGIDLTYSLTRGIMLPKGTPKDVVDYWAKVFKGPTEDKAFVESQATKGTNVEYLGPEDYTAWWKKTDAEFIDAAKKLKFGRFQ
ncbi:Bug family tripartite tricarboxylate transporter substrate binding protein [Thalassospira sp.]|uniref:Bug family tripartite tricarboxylate transporter substrate binding protein n=1 Tax=Thalassospira sp. TaxID=1912094 RepID=UPI003AA8FDC2